MIINMEVGDLVDHPKATRFETSVDALGVNYRRQRKWYVLNDTDNDPHVYEFVDTLADFQAKIYSDNVWGRCESVHIFACANGLADGTLTSSGRKDKEETSVFPIEHRDDQTIAFKDIGKFRVYFDLSAKQYLFYEQYSQYSAEGLVFVSEKGDQTLAEKLYGFKWIEHDYDRSQSDKDINGLKHTFLVSLATPMDALYG